MTKRGQPPLGYTRQNGVLAREPEEAWRVYALFDAIAQGQTARKASEAVGLYKSQALRVLHYRDYAYGELPIVSSALYEEAQRALAARNTKKHKGPRP